MTPDKVVHCLHSLHATWHTCPRTGNDKNLHIHQFFIGTGRICISVGVCGCQQVPMPTRQQRRGNLDQTFTVRYCASFPCHYLLYVPRVHEPKQELQHPSPCRDFPLLTNLAFTGSPQMDLLILPVFKYKQPPGTAPSCAPMFASVTQQHAGTRPDTRRVPGTFPPQKTCSSSLMEACVAEKLGPKPCSAFKQTRFVPDKNATVEIFYSEAQNIIQRCWSGFSFGMRSEVDVCVHTCGLGLSKYSGYSKCKQTAVLFASDKARGIFHWCMEYQSWGFNCYKKKRLCLALAVIHLLLHFFLVRFLQPLLD